MSVFSSSPSAPRDPVESSVLDEMNAAAFDNDISESRMSSSADIGMARNMDIDRLSVLDQRMSEFMEIFESRLGLLHRHLLSLKRRVDRVEDRVNYLIENASS